VQLTGGLVVQVGWHCTVLSTELIYSTMAVPWWKLHKLGA